MYSMRALVFEGVFLRNTYLVGIEEQAGFSSNSAVIVDETCHSNFLLIELPWRLSGGRLSV